MKTDTQILKEIKKLREMVERLQEMVVRLSNEKAFSDATYTHNEAADYLNVSPRTLYNLVNQGKILKRENESKRNTYSEIELNKYKYVG